MTNDIVVEPITRLEGHGELRIKFANDNKTVQNVEFNITSTRFFEKILEGRNFEHVAQIASRICGICPVPHNLAALKAEEDAWGIIIPNSAEKLRRLMLNGKQINSHALHFFALAAPDLIYGPFADPSKRNVVEIIKDLPDVGIIALKIMDFGNEISKTIGGREVHPSSGIIGGMRKPLNAEIRDSLLAQIPEQKEYLKKTYELALQIFEKYDDFISKYAVVPTYYMGTSKNGIHDIYNGNLVITSPSGKREEYAPQDYLKVIGEKTMPHTFTGHTYYRPIGYPQGIFRTNTLANLNCCDNMATPWADEALHYMRKKFNQKIIHNTFAFHWARVIEMIAAFEAVEKLLKDPQIISNDIKEPNITPREGRGVGMVDAPRGNLIYDLQSNKEGLCTKANILVSTNNNVAGIEKSVMEGAKQIWEQNILEKIQLPPPIVPPKKTPMKTQESIGNLLEMIVRCYDCCLSCSAHLVLIDSSDKEILRRPLSVDKD